MMQQTSHFISLDLPPLLTATFAALSCALLGNFLVLRKISLMGDAISHSVLPGIVTAFLLSGSRASVAVFIGAAAAGVISAILVEMIRQFGRLESGAAMGVVFSIMFAAGVVLMEQAAARNIDLDADCLLHGQLETIFWYPPANLFDLKTLALIPQEVLMSGFVFLLSLIFVGIFYKELAFAAFDPALATSLGFNALFLHHLLMIFVAGAVVASFTAVGSILVIAMIICPAATARYFTDRLRAQILLSLLFAICTSVGGYCLGAFGPGWLGYSNSVNTAGMMTVIAGLLLFGSALLAPRYGIISRQLRRFRLSLQVCREDILALLYRLEELSGGEKSMLVDELRAALKRTILFPLAFRQLRTGGEIDLSASGVVLSDRGRAKAGALVRSHRLWESFLVEKAGMLPDHVHASAEQLEHFTRPELSKRLAESQEHPERDPHGRIIPKQE